MVQKMIKHIQTAEDAEEEHFTDKIRDVQLVDIQELECDIVFNKLII